MVYESTMPAKELSQKRRAIIKKLTGNEPPCFDDINGKNIVMSLKNKCPLESEEQEKVFSWINANKKKYPELALAHASLNGVKLSPGAAVKAKKQGMVAGVPDIFLPIPRDASQGMYHSDYYGLFIELKRIKGSKISPEQTMFMTALEDQGYMCKVCYGADEAIETIKQYLNIKD